MARGATVPVGSVIAAGACCFARWSSADSVELVHWAECVGRVLALLRREMLLAVRVCCGVLAAELKHGVRDPAAALHDWRWCAKVLLPLVQAFVVRRDRERIQAAAGSSYVDTCGRRYSLDRELLRPVDH